MRELSEDLKSHLVIGATTLCQCWMIVRADGVVQGFTDHDDVLSFDDIVFQPQSGLTASEAVTNLGLGVDTSEIEGALQSEKISETALHAGDYDNAKVTVFVVNWQAVEQRTVLRVADIGEVTCEDGLFRAELRGLMHELNQVQGRLFENTCDADLGDARCMVDLSNAAFNAQGTLTTVLDTQTFLVEGVDTFPDGWFDRGLLTWTSGENLDRVIEVDSQFSALSGSQLRIWLPMPAPIKQGDTFSLVTGCDKLFPTCQSKFNNATNFRGFPHIPGNDFAYRFARAGRGNNGKPLVR
ncbi:MAG: DUF2163 domain-containing protein [Hyphomicrobiales bacterium]